MKTPSIPPAINAVAAFLSTSITALIFALVIVLPEVADMPLTCVEHTQTTA